MSWEGDTQPSPPSFLQTLCGFSPSASKRVLLSSDMWVRGLLVAESSESSFYLLLLGQKTLWSSTGCPDYPLTFCLVDFCSSPSLPQSYPSGTYLYPLFSLFSLSILCLTLLTIPGPISLPVAPLRFSPCFQHPLVPLHWKTAQNTLVQNFTPIVLHISNCF